MTDPTGGVPNQGAPVPPPAAPVPPVAPVPPPVQGGYEAPPPVQGGYQAPPPVAPVPPPVAPVPPPVQGGFQAPPQGAPTYAAPQFQQAPVAAGPAPGIAYADIVPRIIALVIDGLILFIPFFVISAVLGAILGGFGAFLASLALAAASAGYFVYTWTTMRATYGQKFQKLECVSAADGATLTQPQAIRRWAFLFGPNALVTVIANFPIWAIAALGSLLGLVAFGYAIYLLWTTSQSQKRQGFHDLQAGTVVVKHI